MIVSSPAYLGTCINLIKLTGSAAEFKTTQIPLFLGSGSPEAQTSSYSPCLPSTSQQSIYFTEFMFISQSTIKMPSEIDYVCLILFFFLVLSKWPESWLTTLFRPCSDRRDMSILRGF